MSTDALPSRVKLVPRGQPRISREDAHRFHAMFRRRWLRRLQHLALDRLMLDGHLHVSDLDGVALPEGMSRSIVGSAINTRFFRF